MWETRQDCFASIWCCCCVCPDKIKLFTESASQFSLFICCCHAFIVDLYSRPMRERAQRTFHIIFFWRCFVLLARLACVFDIEICRIAFNTRIHRNTHAHSYVYCRKTAAGYKARGCWTHPPYMQKLFPTVSVLRGKSLLLFFFSKCRRCRPRRRVRLLLLVIWLVKKTKQKNMSRLISTRIRYDDCFWLSEWMAKWAMRCRCISYQMQELITFNVMRFM